MALFIVVTAEGWGVTAALLLLGVVVVAVAVLAIRASNKRTNAIIRECRPATTNETERRDVKYRASPQKEGK